MARMLGNNNARLLVCSVIFALCSFGELVAAESVVIIQGYQAQAEKYAANTVDAYLKALGAGEGSTVSALRPKSQPGWEGGDTYENKASLLDLLRARSVGSSLTVILVGDADGPDGSLAVGSGIGVSAVELADAVSAVTSVSLVSAGCNTLATEIGERLETTSVIVTGASVGQTAHTWPSGDRGQYDLFSRYLLEGYYLLSTNEAVSGSVSDLIAQAFDVASRKMVSRSGGRQRPASNTTATAGSASTPVVSVGNREYGFTIQETANGSLAGYVSNALGLPISPVQSGGSASGQASFMFTDRDRERSATVSDVSGVPTVTIDGRPVSFAYRPARVDLLCDGRPVGVTYVSPVFGAQPSAETLAREGSSASGYRYDSQKATLDFTLHQDAEAVDVRISFQGLGVIQVQVGSSPAYGALDVVHYGFYDAEGNRVATASGTLSGGKLAGQVKPAVGEMRFPLDADLKAGNLTGAASLVGNAYTLNPDWTWTSNRAPAHGVIQPDYLGLPVIETVFADAGQDDGSVEVSWEVDREKASDALVLGDLRFQVVRTDRFDNEAEIFDIPAGRRRYTDRPTGDAKGFDYTVRAVLDHRVTSCQQGAVYPILGEPVVAVSGVLLPPSEKPAPVAAVAPTPVVSQAAELEPEATPEKEFVAEVPKPEAPRAEGEPEKVEDDPKEPEGDLPLWRRKEKTEGVGGKIVYGVLGVLILIGLTIAAGGGGSPSDMEPN